MEDLIALASAGDRQAFTRLVAAHQNVVSTIALAISRDVSTSEDVAQEVFLKAWTGLRELRDPTRFRPWLCQLARNTARETLRSRRRRPAELKAPDALEMVNSEDPRPNADEALSTSEEARTLARAIEALPEDAREIVLLYYREERSAAQVAGLLGIREEAVRQRLSRARTQLRDRMLDTLGDIALHTAPTAAFTATVIAGLVTVGTPATAHAAGAGVAVGARATLGPLFGSIGAGLAGGLISAALAIRRVNALARYPHERRALRAFNPLFVVAVIVGTVSVPVAKHFWGATGQATALLGFMVTTTFMAQVWLRHLLRQTLSEKKLEDAARYRRGRIVRWLLLAASNLFCLGYFVWALDPTHGASDAARADPTHLQLTAAGEPWWISATRLFGIAVLVLGPTLVLRWRYRVEWKSFALGAGSWIVGNVAKGTLYLLARAVLRPVLPMLAFAAFVGLLSAASELGAAAWLFRRVRRSWPDAIAFGVGVGVFELLALLPFLFGALGKHHAAPMPPASVLLALAFVIERGITLVVHASSRVLVFCSLQSRRWGAAASAVALLAAVDGVADFGHQAHWNFDAPSVLGGYYVFESAAAAAAVLLALFAAKRVSRARPLA